jgi:hypothetical protein
LQRSNALAAAGNPNLPQSVRDQYQKAADHLDLSLGLEDALNQKAQRQSLNQLPPLNPSPSPFRSQSPDEPPPSLFGE